MAENHPKIMVSQEELEIMSTNFDAEESANCESTMQDADRRTVNIANTIIQLKDDLNDLQQKHKHKITAANEGEMCNVKKQLAEQLEEYKIAMKQVLTLAKKINFNVNDLKCRKINVDQKFKADKCPTFVVKDDDPDLCAPLVLLDNGTAKPKVFVHEHGDADKVYELYDSESAWCSCEESDVSEVSECCDCEADGGGGGGGGRGGASAADRCAEVRRRVDTGYEKDMIRDELMIVQGGMKLLREQNRNLLNKINCANQKQTELTKITHITPALNKCRVENKMNNTNNHELNSKLNALISENKQLNGELKEMKRDRCQIELARKVLNVAETQCANCIGSSDHGEVFRNLKCLTEDNIKLKTERDVKESEITDLRAILDKEKHCSKTYKECLVITKAQVAQLEKQLFDLNSAKSHDPEVLCSNDKYLMGNFKYRLQEANEEKANMQMVLDFHLSELEDKKAKYLAVLQTNEGQIHRIDILNKEKAAIAKEYEAEFNRMSEHLKSRLEEIETLPGVIATLQRDLEQEKNARTELENERDTLMNEIDSLRVCLAHEDTPKCDNDCENLEEEITQLRATVMTLEDSVAENKRLYMERTHYALQLKEQLNTVREEAALQMTKTKDFSECQKLKYTEYIDQLEQQLAESRALSCAEFRKRDFSDERMRQRILKLTENLNEAHEQIRELSLAKELIVTEFAEDRLCKVFPVTKSSCHDFNNPKHIQKHKEN